MNFDCQPPSTRPVLGTPLAATTYSDLAGFLFERSKKAPPYAVDFSNTHIVTLRRHDPGFRQTTSAMDLFVPDGMPLIWAMNRIGANLRDRVYGPTFLSRAVELSSESIRHYFLGGSEECLQKLLDRVKLLNPRLTIAGSHHGYFPQAEEAGIVDLMTACQPDFIWLGLGTPKQQAWIARNKHRFQRGILLAVGFAFDVNAGTKVDAPLWMQRRGLTWLFRLVSEPARLGPRYLKFNSLFCYYLLREIISGRNTEAQP